MPELQSKDILDKFFQQFKSYNYKKRSLIMHPTDNPSSVFYIKSGYLRVYRISEQGDELTLTILKPHDFFPLTYGITQSRNPYYLESMTSLELWKAPVESFKEFIIKEPEVYRELMDRLLIRFDGFLNRMEHLVFSNAYSKVAATLLLCAKRLGQQVGNKFAITVPLTHKDIATLIGITRETTSLEIKKLEKEGFLEKKGRTLYLTNTDTLEALVTTDTNSERVFSF